APVSGIAKRSLATIHVPVRSLARHRVLFTSVVCWRSTVSPNRKKHAPPSRRPQGPNWVIPGYVRGCRRPPPNALVEPPEDFSPASVVGQAGDRRLNAERPRRSEAVIYRSRS